MGEVSVWGGCICDQCDIAVGLTCADLGCIGWRRDRLSTSGLKGDYLLAAWETVFGLIVCVERV